MYCFEESRGEVSFQVCVKFSSVAECLGLRYMLKLKDSVFFFFFLKSISYMGITPVLLVY